MTRDEATAACERLAREHPDRETHSWLPRRGANGEWAVVKLGVPARRPTGTTQEARPRPPQPDDPGPPMWRDVGGPWGGG